MSAGQHSQGVATAALAFLAESTIIHPHTPILKQRRVCEHLLSVVHLLVALMQIEPFLLQVHSGCACEYSLECRSLHCAGSHFYALAISRGVFTDLSN